MSHRPSMRMLRHSIILLVMLLTTLLASGVHGASAADGARCDPGDIAGDIASPEGTTHRHVRHPSSLIEVRARGRP